MQLKQRAQHVTSAVTSFVLLEQLTLASRSPLFLLDHFVTTVANEYEIL